MYTRLSSQFKNSSILRESSFIRKAMLAGGALCASVFALHTMTASELGQISDFNVLYSVNEDNDSVSIPGISDATPEERNKLVKQFLRCEQMKQHALGHRKVRFMFNSLAELGNIILEPEKYIQCMHCDAPLNAFALTHPETTSMVAICQNYLRDESALVDAVTHELVHVYDNIRAEVDISNCVHVACTEVRASMLSGECSRDKEITRGAIPIGLSEPAHFKKCIRRRAKNSVLAQPACSDPKVCAEAMDLAFERCFQDRAPFYAIPE